MAAERHLPKDIPRHGERPAESTPGEQQEQNQQDGQASCRGRICQICVWKKDEKGKAQRLANGIETQNRDTMGINK